jgi:hypothetical protein
MDSLVHVFHSTVKGTACGKVTGAYAMTSNLKLVTCKACIDAVEKWWQEVPPGLKDTARKLFALERDAAHVEHDVASMYPAADGLPQAGVVRHAYRGGRCVPFKKGS